MHTKPLLRPVTLLLAACALMGAAGAALAQTPASVPTTPEPSMSATPAVAPPPAGAIVATPRPATATRVPQPNAPASPPAGRPTLTGPTITITQQDSGRTFNVSLNQQIVIQLGATLDWTVAYQPEGILLAVPGVNTLTRGTQAILYAAAPGTVSITAQGKPICTAGQPCPQFIAQFQATVIVAGGSTTTQQPAAPTAAQQPAPSASLPTQPVRLPNTGGRAGDAPLFALLLGAAALALAGLGTWRWKDAHGKSN